jgi:hypothetical protein
MLVCNSLDPPAGSIGKISGLLVGDVESSPQCAIQGPGIGSTQAAGVGNRVLAEAPHFVHVAEHAAALWPRQVDAESRSPKRSSGRSSASSSLWIKAAIAESIGTRSALTRWLPLMTARCRECVTRL